MLSIRQRNQQSGMITEDTQLPVRILSCNEGKPTQYGTETLRFTFQHIASKEEFTSIVLEQKGPDYIDDQIINAVLPPNVLDYSLEELSNLGLFVQVKFITRGNNTFINVVKAEVLDEKHKQMLEELLSEEKHREMG